MKIYTSYFGKLGRLNNRGIIPIGISVKLPDWAVHDCGNRWLKTVAPRYDMLKMEWAQYVKEYIAILGKLDSIYIMKFIKKVSEDNDCALLCWEKERDNCHRKLLGMWLESEFGIVVEEFDLVKTDVQKELF